MRASKVLSTEKIPVSNVLSLGSEVEHGGNIYRLAEELNIPESKVIDFSASINPLGVSEKVKAGIKNELQNLHNYPDPDTKKLNEKIAQYHNIDSGIILCSNGSTELICLIPRALKPGTVLIPSPAFSEYERACRTAGYELRVISYELKEENNFDINPDKFIKTMERIRKNNPAAVCMTYLCNPNNPTGRLLRRAGVRKIADAAKKIKCYLVVDEAFIDFHPEESVIKDVQNNPYLIVLRSMTKFYALTGLRIGYGVFSRSLIEELKKLKEPWTVNSLGQKAAIAALEDDEYADKTFRLIKSEKEFLQDSFKETGIKFYPSDANFYLLKINNNSLTCLKLRKKGILVRDCSNFKGLDSSYIRIAVRSRRENKILIKALKHASNEL